MTDKEIDRIVEIYARSGHVKTIPDSKRHEVTASYYEQAVRNLAGVLENRAQDLFTEAA